MLTRSNVAAASVLCILSWALIFGIYADANGQDDPAPEAMILFGRVTSVTENPDAGGRSLSLENNAWNWTCSIDGDAQCPAVGSQIIAICSLQPGGPPTVLRIIYPWTQNVF
jgi:hypothetical protein